MKILWLASWYPSKLDPFNGDFIQRHAQAASLYNDIEVIHIIKDRKGAVTKTTKILETKKGRLTERVVYYFAAFQNIPLLGKLVSEYHYRRLYRAEIRRYMKLRGRPDVVHVHVAMKAGISALWANHKYTLPYIVTEHSTLFLRGAEHKIEHLPFYIQKGFKKILRKSAAISVVSEHLGKSMQPFLHDKKYVIIPNVVNTEIFTPLLKKNDMVRFIHVSSLTYQKSIDSILEALAIVKNKRQNFILDIFGPYNSTVINKANDLGLNGFINFHSEVPQKQLSLFMQKADALILYSRYETFGCVVIEANACGVPVIVSDIPAMREIIVDSFNGILVKKDDAAYLAEVLTSFIDDNYKFDASKIAALCQEKYGYKPVGLAFSEWYKAVLQRLGSSTPA